MGKCVKETRRYIYTVAVSEGPRLFKQLVDKFDFSGCVTKRSLQMVKQSEQTENICCRLLTFSKLKTEEHVNANTSDFVRSYSIISLEMPEGPELHISCLFINKSVKGLTFSGKPLKSDVSKNPIIEWDVPFYKITASSRGKEMKLWLEECSPSGTKLMQPRKMSILFRFGMSGLFKLTTTDDIPKHSHLRFYTLLSGSKSVQQVLSFVDFRRFGHWMVNSDWGSDRGPCPITDYENFRKNVINNLEENAFKNKAICEVLLNQKYFNGIGNYLRAEILFRSKIPPFEDAYTSLIKWKDSNFHPIKSENGETEVQDPLYLCHLVCHEVLQLSDGYDVENGLKVDGAFEKWLRCYQNPDMKCLIDKNKRTIWFDGEPGSLVPKDCKSRQPRKKRQIVTEEDSEVSIKIETITKVPKLETKESTKVLTTRSTRRSPRFSAKL